MSEMYEERTKKIARKNGDSLIISLPPGMCATVGIQAGTVLDVKQIGNKITLTPIGEAQTKKLED